LEIQGIKISFLAERNHADLEMGICNIFLTRILQRKSKKNITKKKSIKKKIKQVLNKKKQSKEK